MYQEFQKIISSCCRKSRQSHPRAGICSPLLVMLVGGEVEMGLRPVWWLQSPRCLSSCLLQAGRAWGCSPPSPWAPGTGSHRTDPFHHPTSLIPACPMAPLRSCPSGTLLSPIVLALDAFSCLVSVFPAVPALHAPSPWGSPSWEQCKWSFTMGKEEASST